jgi:replicative DNA helicase
VVGGLSKIERVTPQALEAEQSTLGSMLIDRSAAEVACEILKADDFYRDAHKTVFGAIQRIAAADEPIDLITVVDELRSSNKLDGVGGASYIHSLIDSVPSAARVEHYAKIVQEKAILRRMIAACSQISGMCYGDITDVESLVDSAEQLVFEVGQRRIRQYFSPLAPLLHDAFERIEAVYREKSVTQGVPTGFGELDFYTSGLHPSDLIIVAARPSMGKTSLCLNIAANVALGSDGKPGAPVAIFTIEMSRDQLVQRLICQQARVDAHRLRTGYFPDSHWEKLADGVETLRLAPIFIDDSADISVLEMRGKCRRLKAEVGLGLIIVDYLQLARPHTKADSRVEQISEVARSLKTMARELSVPVVAAAQLSRAVEQRPDKRPILSDLRESGSIEAEADVVCLLYRQAYYERGKLPEITPAEYADSDYEHPGEETEIIIAKQRHGPVGSVRVAFVPQYASFFDLEAFRDEQ